MATFSNYLPESESQLVVWFNNLQTKLLTYATTFGLTGAETTAVTNDYNAIAYMMAQVEAIKANSQDRVQYKARLLRGPSGAATAFPGDFIAATPPTATVTPGVLDRIRALARRLKAHPNYTKAIGEDLGIVAPDVTSPRSPRPRGTARSVGSSQIGLTFVKLGFSGVRVESKRGPETAWSYLGTYIVSPFTDSRGPLVAGMPESRSYRLQYVRGNDPVGEFSDTLTVSTEP